MSSEEARLQLPKGLRQESSESRTDWPETGSFAVDLLGRTIGRGDLSEVNLLDLGSGTKIVKALLDYPLPIGHYTGLDFSAEVIEWLKTNVTDPRFEFHLLGAHNPWLNPDGEPLESFDLLPLGPRQFDLICLFSVFTHLAPEDYVAMLRLLRRHVHGGGTLLFTLHLLDTDHPAPLEEDLRGRLNSDIPGVRARAAANIEQALQRRAARDHDARFVDWDPDEPLARAQYTEDYAIELVDGTGWEIEAIHPPGPYIDHYMVCRPI